MSFHWSDEGNKSYISRAKDVVLDWAAEHSNGLQKCGERVMEGGFVAGAASVPIMAYLGVKDPGTMSKFMIYAGAPVFALGELMQVTAQYARDRKNGEIDPIKNAGYVTRVLAPFFAIYSGANGIWEPGYDVIAPVTAWAAGKGATRLGEGRTHKKKVQEAKRTRDWFERSTGTDPTHFMMDMVKEYEPDADIKLVANYVPLREIIDQREGAIEIIKESKKDDPSVH